VVQKKGAAEVAAALAQLNAAKTGSKRLDNFELKEEKAVYDVVDDEQYAQLVTKRRIEAGKWAIYKHAASSCFSQTAPAIQY
jgi:DNA polymerase alpha subunit A